MERDDIPRRAVRGSGPPRNPEPESEREVIITRVFDVPARILFAAYREPAHLKRWFGPGSWPLTTAEVDFRVGGRYHFVMTGPDGREGPPFGGEYLEIVPDRKIVYTNGFDDPDSPTMTITVTLDERDGTTTLTMRTLFESAAAKQQFVGMGFVDGTSMGFDQLAAYARTVHAGS